MLSVVHQTLSLLEGRVWQRHYIVMEDFYYRFRCDHIHVHVMKFPDRRGVLIMDAIRGVPLKIAPNLHNTILEFL